MSYKLTEAERKSIAVIEDLDLYFERKEGDVPETILHLTDGDKLDLSCTLPKYKFVWSDSDDQIARLRLMDEASGFTIECPGLTGTDYFTKEETTLGIGWRYGITFGKDDDGFVNELIFTRLNDGAKVTRTFKNFTDLTIKNLNVGTEETGGNLKVYGPATFVAETTFEKDVKVEGALAVEGATVVEGTLTVSEDATLAGVKVTGTEVDATGHSVKADSATVGSAKATTFEVGDDGEKTISTIKNATITAEKSNLVMDDDSSITSGEINTNKATVKDAEIEELNVSGAAVIKGDVTLGGRFKCDMVTADENGIHIQTPNSTSEGGTGINVEGSISITGETNVVGNEVISGTASVGGDIDADGNINVVGDVDVQGAEEIAGAVTFDDTLDVGGDTTISGKLTVESHTTVPTLDVTEKAVIQVGTVNTITSDSATITDETVSTSRIGTLDVSGNETVGGNLDVTGDITADDFTSETVATKKLTSTIAKSTKSEADFATVNDDLTVKGDVAISGTEVVDKIESSAGDNLLTTAGSKTTLGSNAKQTVLETTSDPSLRVTDTNYGHVKAIVDNVEQYLATTEDIENIVNPLGIVDRYSNQTISGIKTFENQMVAQGGVTAKDDDGNIRNMISHTEDPNNVETVTNPVYTQAVADKATYDETYAKYADVYTQYNEAVKAKNVLANAQAVLDAANEAETSAQTAYDEAETEKIAADSALEAQTTAVTNATTAKADADAAVTTAQTAYDEAEAAYEEAKTANDAGDVSTYDIYNMADADGNTLAALVKGMKSNDTVSAAFDGLSTSRTDFSYEDAISELSNVSVSFKAVVKLTSEAEVVDNATLGISVASSVKSDVTSAHSSTVAALQTAFNTASSAKQTASDNLTTANNTAATAASTLEAENTKLTKATATAKSAETTLEAASSALETAKANVTSAEATVAAAKSSYDTEVAEYYASYKTYTNTSISVLDDTFPLTEPEKPSNVQELEAGSIPETILKGIGEVLYVGDSSDEMQIKSKALADGDEHIQATIGGHAHLLANKDDLDDINSNVAVHDIQVAISDNKVTLNKVTNTVAGGSEVTEAVKTLTFDSNFTVAEDGAIGLGGDITGLTSRVATLESANEAIQTALTDVTSAEDSITFDNADGSQDVIKFTETAGAKLVGADGELTVSLPRVDLDYSDVPTKYANLAVSDDNKNLIPSALDAKLLHDDAVAAAEKIGLRLEERVPVAPTTVGTYGLRANVVAKSSDSDDTSVTYTWDGTSVLPTADIDNGDQDIDGNALELYTDDNPVEYGLKMRIVEVEDSYGNKKKVPQIGWMRIK